MSRDIHAKYQWGVAAKNAPKLDKVSTVTSVLGVVADTGIGAVNKYGEVSADGFVDCRNRDFGICAWINICCKRFDLWSK